ncbi:MAG: M14 family metallopeptidase [Bacteroidetes bacterium]|nr:M14 family metallopeptidase [Bacteroidota bacterium]
MNRPLTIAAMTLRTFVLLLLTVPLAAQQTRPERTNYEETSRYQDVMDFIGSLKIDDASMKLTWLGYSFQGRRLPMIVYGDVPDARPETISRSGKVVVYIQANIHAGEVEGKEAMLELLRELRGGNHAAWKRRLVLLIVPIYNADGNELVSLHNRPWQHGPMGGMGQRANGQGLDLNRDHIKLEAPETVSFVRMLNEYDPHITLDLHTTNGSFHGYHITYSFALNPMVDEGLDAYTRNEFFPKVTAAMAAKKWRIHRYGDYLERTPAGPAGYYFWAHEPRFNSNYVGFRNRLAILCESYSYLPFRQRIASMKALVVSILDVAGANASAVKSTVAAAERNAMSVRPGDSLSVRAAIVESQPAQEILLAPVIEERNPYSGEVMYRMNEDSLRTIVTKEYYASAPLKRAAAPLQYALPDSLTELAALLQRHGIRIDTLRSPVTVAADRFIITQNRQAEREFQKHRMRTLEGRFVTDTMMLPAGTLLVPMQQPLSRLAFTILEPESEDGAVAWNVLDDRLGNGTEYPIHKIKLYLKGR